MLKHMDLFSGYGGFSIACERNNIETIGFSEIDKYASAVLKYHWPNTKNYGDITKIDWSEVPDFDLLTGGSPCQDLSIAGKRKGLGGERSGLFYEFMRAVRCKKPKYFIWENVKGALSSNRGFDFLSVLNEMAEAGYSLWWQVLNAKDFGVPQNRERIFVVGFRDESPREVFFEPATNGKTIEQLNEPQHSNDRVYGEDGLSPCLNTMQGGMRQPFITGGLQKNASTMYNRSTAMTSAMGLGGGHTPILNAIRRLTPTECERLMGLPDDWTKLGMQYCDPYLISDSQRYKMCGNGVVVNVVEEIVKELIIK